MKNSLKVFSLPIAVALSFGVLGCAGVPMTRDVEQVIGKPFTNPPRPEKRWVTIADQQGRVMTVLVSDYSIRGNRYKSQGNLEEPPTTKSTVKV